MNETRRKSYSVIKLEAVIRWIACHYLSERIPFYIVNEYPKSGGSWFAQMLSDYLSIPFSRNVIPKIIPPTPQVLHGHYRYHPGLKNVFCVIRDGRDVMVSFYYHSLFVHESGLNWHEVEITHKKLEISDPENIYDNLPKFIESKFTHSRLPRFAWSEFCKDWIDKDVPIIKYEDMLTDAQKVLFNVLVCGLGIEPDIERLAKIVEKYSFNNLAVRKAGKENVSNFLRKGIAGDWRGKFSQEAREIFHHYAGDVLIELGYEKNNSWV